MTSICLIAEADPFIASLLQRFAEESGLHSVRARTGEEILALVRQAQTALLIVDPELPGEVRGWEAVRALRAEAEAKAQAEVKVEGVLAASTLTSALTSNIAVISCSWLNRADARRLLGDVAGHLQKPELHYADFLRALAVAGTAIKDQGDVAHNRF